MRKLLVVLLAFGLQAGAQDMAHYKKIVKEISSAKYQGRGYAKGGANKAGRFLAFVVTTLIYALVHIWSFNFMLIMAALVAGAIWGFVYWLQPKSLPALVISHALWDALVFVWIPI